MDQILNDLINLVYPGGTPTWIYVVAIIVVLGPALNFITFMWDCLSKLRKRIQKWIFYLDEENAAKVNERKNFAKRVALELSILNSQETWQDERFTELEAEIEADDRWHHKSSWLPIRYAQKGIHREKSLFDALEKTREPLILLEGEPGSGKSVVLRHLALKLAQMAGESRDLHSIIPLYINLKDLKVNPLEEVSPNAIREFIFWFLNKQNDRNLANFLEQEFDVGIKEGTWLFLFDSFDEIPDVLSSTQVDNTVQKYTLALSRFLFDLGKCRGIIASRYFRGPELVSWPRFKIQSLNEKRRIELIKKSGLNKKAWVRLINDLESAPDQVREMAKNPMFLSLLCENIKDGKQFPDHIHNVYEDFIEERLKRDEVRIQKRFHVATNTLRTHCEFIAFCMTSDPGLGLSPDRVLLKQSLSTNGFPLTENIDSILDAIEFTRLGKGISLPTDNNKQFTFAHRRLQEYFATCLVISGKGQVSPKQLIMDGRWRETVVTLLQIQPETNLSPILFEIEKVIDTYISNIRETESDYSYSCRSRYYIEWPKKVATIDRKEQLPVPFNWTAELIHILSILKNGIDNRSDVLPDAFRGKIAFILDSAFETGLMLDKKWALEFISLVPQVLMEKRVLDGITIEDRWLDDVIYQQIRKLSYHPEKIKKGILVSIISLVITGRYWEEKYATQAYLQRLSDYHIYAKLLRSLIWLPLIDFLINSVIVAFLARLFFLNTEKDSTLPAGLIYIFGFYSLVLAMLALPLISRLSKKFRNMVGTRIITINNSINEIRILVLFSSTILGFFAIIELLLTRTDLVNLNLIILFLIFLLANAWPATYFAFIKRIRPLNPLLWIFSPIALQFHVLLSSIRILVKAPKTLIDFYKNFKISLGKVEFIIFCAFTSVLIITVVILFGFIFSLTNGIELSLTNYSIIPIVLILLSLSRYFRSRYLKTKLFNRLKNINVLDMKDTLPLLEYAYKHGIGDDVVKYIRERQLLIITPETENAIQKLTTIVQFSRRMFREGFYVHYYLTSGKPNHFFDIWLEDLQNRNKDVNQIVPWSAMIELNRILEQHKRTVEKVIPI